MTLALLKAAAGTAILLVGGHTFAEFYRGGTRTAREAHLVNQWRPEVVHVGSAEGKFAGELLAETGRDNSMDALVVACAALHSAQKIYTSDPDDLRGLCAHLPRGSRPIAVVDVR
jgi:predicted nucleic acid-binding protein